MAAAGSTTGGCGATCGIQVEREREKSTARACALRAYPGLRWRDEPAAREAEPLGAREALELAEQLAERVPVKPVWVEPEARGGHSLWLLVGDHAVSWLECWEGLRDDAKPEHTQETLLRMHLSPLGPWYTLQEVTVRATPEGEGAWVEQRRLRGLEDRRLAALVKPVQGYLRKCKLVALDAVFLAEPGEGAAPSGDAVSLWTLLFRDEPAATELGLWLD